ncbi:hypothetical protein V8E51_002565 [Hyaloscypha variabilis]
MKFFCWLLNPISIIPSMFSGLAALFSSCFPSIFPLKVPQQLCPSIAWQLISRTHLQAYVQNSPVLTFRSAPKKGELNPSDHWA